MIKLKNLLEFNSIVIVLVFILTTLGLCWQSYEAIWRSNEKDLIRLLDYETALLNEKMNEYRMTLETVKSVLDKTFEDKRPIDDKELNAIVLSLISNQENVSGVYYALEPEYAKKLKNNKVYIYALLKDLDLAGTKEFSKKENIASYEYFDGDYPTNPKLGWYHMAKESPQVQVTGPYFDEFYMEFSMLTAVAPIKGEKGEFAGTIGLDVPLSVLLLENAKRNRRMHYRTVITNEEGVSLEALLAKENFMYPEEYLSERDYQFNVSDYNFKTQNETGALRIKQGKHNYNVVYGPAFNNKLRVFILQDTSVAKAPFFVLISSMGWAVVVTLFVTVFLFSNMSYKIRSNIKNLYSNFKINIKNIKHSKENFSPVYIKQQMSILDLEEIRLEWESFLDEFNIILKELRAERDHSLKLANFQASFLATMSHEIRTPMNAIMGMADLLEGTEMSGDQKEMVEVFNAASENLLSLLNDILDVSKIESGNMVIEKVKVDLEKIKSDIESVFNKKAKQQGLDFSFHIHKNTPRYILEDPIRLKQIIINLVSNAIKFTQKGVVKVDISLREQDANKIRIKVEDTGVGIPQGKFSTIFQKFVQADVSTTRKFGGSGLGLSIVKSLTDLLGGTIFFNSKEGIGTTFIIDLPVVSCSHNNGEALTDNEVSTQGKENLFEVLCLEEGQEILVADDVDSNRAVISMYLTKLGISYQLAKDGVEAEKYFMESPQKYPIVFLDIQMPHRDGVTTLKNIKKVIKQKNLSTKVIALSAFASVQDKERYLKEGFDGYITKPLKKTQLVDVIKDCLKEELEQNTKKAA